MLPMFSCSVLQEDYKYNEIFNPKRCTCASACVCSHLLYTDKEKWTDWLSFQLGLGHICLSMSQGEWRQSGNIFNASVAVHLDLCSFGLLVCDPKLIINTKNLLIEICPLQVKLKELYNSASILKRGLSKISFEFKNQIKQQC